MTDKWAHFSIDDVFLPLANLNQSTMTSLFDEPFFALLKRLHETYDIKVSLYCYFEQQGKNLMQVSSAFRDEFIAHSNWMKFGFHGKNETFGYKESTKEQFLDDMSVAMDELIRIVGKESLTSTIRLHFYEGNSDVVESCKEQGMDSLLTNERDKLSYDLTDFDVDILKNSQIRTRTDGMTFIKTSLRIEECEKMENVSISSPYFVFFTHEWALRETSNVSKLETLIDRISQLGYEYSFFEQPKLMIRFPINGQDLKELNKMITRNISRIRDRLPITAVLVLVTIAIWFSTEMIGLVIFLIAFTVIITFFPQWIQYLFGGKAARQSHDYHSENAFELKNECFLFHAENEESKTDYRVNYSDIIRIHESEKLYGLQSKGRRVYFFPKDQADDEFMKFLNQKLQNTPKGGVSNARK